MAEKGPVLVDDLYSHLIRAGEAGVAEHRGREILADALPETHRLQVHGPGENLDGILLAHYPGRHMRGERLNAQDTRPRPHLLKERLRTHMDV